MVLHRSITRVNTKNVEGKKILIDYRGNMERLLVELQEDLQSSISYVGGTKTADLINAGDYCN